MMPELPQSPLILQIAAALLTMGSVAGFLICFCVIIRLFLRYNFSEDYRDASSEVARSNKAMNDFLLSAKFSRERRILYWTFPAIVLCMLLLLLLSTFYGPISIG
ncbi:hypothetical protein [Roseibium sp.]|uniref:hypothetical protein n=1 Tax=Roseibium sp. TaxID=1936156 RepID=UPI003BABBDA9